MSYFAENGQRSFDLGGGSIEHAPPVTEKHKLPETYSNQKSDE
jgi:hypothetical protein